MLVEIEAPGHMLEALRPLRAVRQKPQLTFSICDVPVAGDEPAIGAHLAAHAVSIAVRVQRCGEFSRMISWLPGGSNSTEERGIAMLHRDLQWIGRRSVGISALLAGVAAALGWWYALSPATGFMPHGVCYAWNPALIRLHAFSDALIGLAYFSIPPALWYFVRKRVDLPFSWIFLLFGLFIIACGSTHWMELWTLWQPVYWLSGFVKAFTAAASVPTAIALVFLIPHALSIPSLAEIRRARDDLAAEVAERKRIEEQLRQAQGELELRIAERTSQLAQSNSELNRQREWFQTTLASIGDAVIATGTEGRILLLNKAAEELTGWAQAEAAGKPLPE